MARDWQEIRKQRVDLTDYLLHLTKARDLDPTQKTQKNVPRVTARDALRRILEEGILRAGWGWVPHPSGFIPTIHGETAAVCFSEAPLAALWSKGLPDRFSSYGVAMHRFDIWTFGGRPVIYDDELSELPDKMRYRGVKFSPADSRKRYGSYPLDWTHEREWRVPKNVPLYIGDVADPPLRVLVAKDADVPDFRALLSSITKIKAKARARFHVVAEESQIISLETLKRMPRAKRPTRIDDLPKDKDIVESEQG